MNITPAAVLRWPRSLAQARERWRPGQVPPGDVLATPDAFTERVTWEEPAIFYPATIAASGVYEIVRVQLGQTEIFILERLATFLVAAHGDVTVITLDGGDPSIGVAQDGGNILRWRWHLRFDDQELSPLFVVAGTRGDLPSGGIDGISPTWNDQRYQWGSRYGQLLRILTAGPGYIRLFIEFDLTGEPWGVRFGGLLGGWRQVAGTLGAALDSVVKRY